MYLPALSVDEVAEDRCSCADGGPRSHVFVSKQKFFAHREVKTERSTADCERMCVSLCLRSAGLSACSERSSSQTIAPQLSACPRAGLQRWSAVIMVPAKEASSSQSTDALSHPTSPELSEKDITRIREAVGRLPKYPTTGQWTTDKDLKSKHRLLCTMVIGALTQPDYVLPMHEAYLTVKNAKSQTKEPNQGAKPKSPRSSQTSLPEQTHSKCAKSKGGPSVQESSPQCVGVAKGNPCPTRGRQSSSNPQHQADRSQEEGITQQQQPQKKTDGKTAGAMKARERPREWWRRRECGPVSPGDWLQIYDIHLPYERDPLSRSLLFFEVSLGWMPLMITTCSSYLEDSVKTGDWLWVREVTFDRNGSPSIFQLVKTSKDRELDFQAQFVEATIPEPQTFQ